MAMRAGGRGVTIASEPPVTLHTVTLPGESATPLLVVHGGPGWDHSYLRDPLDELSPERAVVYPDLRGSGRSAPGLPDARCLPEAMAADLPLLLDALSLRRVDVLGFSYGGLIAQRVALAAPERVRSLILAGTSVLPVPPDAFAGCAERDRRTAAADALWRDRALDTADGIRRRALAQATADVWHQDLLPAYRRRLGRVRFTAVGLESLRAGTFPSGRPDDAAARLRAAGLPILLLHGRHDMGFPVDLVARSHRELPGSTFVELPDAAHMAHVDQPERWLGAVRAFLREQDANDGKI